MKSLYDWIMTPLENQRLKTIRKALMSEVSGVVLEIGAGTGANLPFLNLSQIERLVLTDLKLTKTLQTRLKAQTMPAHLEITLQEAPLEKLNLPDGSFDSIVFTLVFCSVQDPLAGLSRVYNLLKPGGKIYFIEHVLPDHPKARKVANRLNPHWNKIASGCNLNRETLETIKAAGFTLQRHSITLGGALIEGVGVKP